MCTFGSTFKITQSHHTEQNSVLTLEVGEKGGGEPSPSQTGFDNQIVLSMLMYNKRDFTLILPKY